MPVTEIVAIVTGVVGCVAGVATIPWIRQPLAEFFGYLKQEPDDSLLKLGEQEGVLRNLMRTRFLGASWTEEDASWETDASKVLDRIEQCQNAGTGFCSNLCPFLANCQRRYIVGKYTPKIEKRVTTLRNRLRQTLGIMNVSLDGEVREFVTTKRFLVGRDRAIQEIMSKYNKPLYTWGTRIFGVYGAIGVGKTEVVAHFCNKISQDQRNCLITFIWVEVASDEDDLQKLQRKIASKLQLELPIDNSVRDNATELKNELQKRKNILLVLDNVRKAFSLEEIGFSTMSYSTITVVITSRSFSVCNQMKCDWKIGLKSLSDEEAYELLINEVDFPRTSSTEEIQSSLKKIAKECGGLPLAIVAVAKYLRKFRGYDRIATERCLKIESTSFSNLKYTEDKVFKDLMLCYEQLEHGSYRFAKECLFYCTMYPRNYSFAEIELMTYWIGEGLFPEVEGIDEKLGKAKETLEEIKDASLLESVTCENEIEIVKMHPLIWDMTVKNKKESLRFFLDHESRLGKITYEDWFKDVERVQLVKNNVKELLPAFPLTKLSTLILQGNPFAIELDRDFFNSLPNLKILDLSDTQVRLLSESISCLKHLTVLLLRNCIRLTCLPSLSGLGALMVLDISGCPIDELPSLSGLGALMVLDISGCPIEELPSLSELVTLMILKASGCRITKLPSLSKLRILMTLDISSCPIQELPDGMNQLPNLGGLKLSQTRVRTFPSGLVAKFNNLQELLTIGCDFSWILRSQMQEASAACIEDIHKLGYLNVLQTTFANLEVYNFYAKSSHCGRLRSFRFCVGESYRSKLRNNSVAFIKVEIPTDELLLPENTSELLLKKCDNVTALTMLNEDNLENLKFLDVSYCKNLKCLFEIGNCWILNNLEEVVIAHCPNLVKVTEDPFPWLPSLRKLTLFELPELRSISDKARRSHSLLAIGIWKCSRLETFPFRFGIDEEQNFIAPFASKIRGDKSWLENLKQTRSESSELITFLEENLIEEPPPEELKSRDT